MELVKRLRCIPSDQEVWRRLWADPELREICGLEEGKPPPHPSTMTRFRRRVGPEVLEGILVEVVKGLVRRRVIRPETVALDATFIRAWSKRDPGDSRKGFSDPEARLRKQGRRVILGYGIHVAVDAESELPVAVVVAPANTNEKKVAPSLLEKTLRHRGVRRLVADKQYSSKRFRETVTDRGVEPVIPYPRNQRRGEKGLLRVDKHFHTHGPERLRHHYRSRTAVERVISRLGDFFSLDNLRLRGLRNAALHVLLCILTMLLTALAALNQGQPEKIRSPTQLRR